MPEEPGRKLRLEIGHVLFPDIVGYSKLLINEQSEQLQKLKEIVRGTEQVRVAEVSGQRRICAIFTGLRARHESGRLGSKSAR